MSTIPKNAIRAYQMQRYMAKRRGISFEFTFEEWWNWWQIDDRWPRRGVGRDKLCMARFKDTGPYHPENVYCATHAENMRDISSEHRSEALKKSWANGRECHLSVRGDGHPRSRSIITPLGRFGSAALAAEAHKMARQTAARFAREGRDGWRYE